ncbi:MAG TPA: chromate resistance protein ChrB domain-containing protein [Thermoanaerobaculia bacterium]|nr:chromate resistance protein ChrB domain-containing protein [Thermoanaerobaculia bacterium]
MPQWLILVHRIPPRPLYLRAKIRQRLAAVGAVAVKNAVYLLPRGTDALEDLQWIAQEIVTGGGDAHLFEGDFVDGVANDTAVAQFRETRDADYAEVAAEAQTAMKAARSAAAAPELAAAHARLTRRLEEIRRIDFFESEGRGAAEEALAAIETRLKKDRKEETRMMEANPELRGKTWVTRPGVKIDRMACAWFIRRFVDPKARFRFDDPKGQRRDGELRFDMVGGDFTHEEDRCTFETLVRRVGLPDKLPDKGVRAIAEIVHDLDLKDTKFDRPETPGVRMMLEGLMARTDSDEERIERALPFFDDLHEALGSRRRK